MDYLYKDNFDDFVHDGILYKVKKLRSNYNTFNVDIQRASERFKALEILCLEKCVYKPVRPLCVNIKGEERLATPRVSDKMIVSAKKIKISFCNYCVVGKQNNLKIVLDADFHFLPYELPFSLDQYFESKGYWDPIEATNFFWEIVAENNIMEHEVIKLYDDLVYNGMTIPDIRPVHTCENLTETIVKKHNLGPNKKNVIALAADCYEIVSEHFYRQGRYSHAKTIAKAIMTLLRTRAAEPDRSVRSLCEYLIKKGEHRLCSKYPALLYYLNKDYKNWKWLGKSKHERLDELISHILDLPIGKILDDVKQHIEEGDYNALVCDILTQVNFENSIYAERISDLIYEAKVRQEYNKSIADEIISEGIYVDVDEIDLTFMEVAKLTHITTRMKINYSDVDEEQDVEDFESEEVLTMEKTKKMSVEGNKTIRDTIGFKPTSRKTEDLFNRLESVLSAMVSAEA